MICDILRQVRGTWSEVCGASYKTWGVGINAS